MTWNTKIAKDQIRYQNSHTDPSSRIQEIKAKNCRKRGLLTYFTPNKNFCGHISLISRHSSSPSFLLKIQNVLLLFKDIENFYSEKSHQFCLAQYFLNVSDLEWHLYSHSHLVN